MKNVFIVGGGFMGGGIAQVAMAAGYSVTLYGRHRDRLEKVRAGIDKSLSKMVAKEKMIQENKDAAMERLSLTDTFDDAKNADIVIEAVVEDILVKKPIFEKLSEICREDCILASNTSSLPLSDLFPLVQHPSRLIGTHFFSPVPQMKLLELVQGLVTSDETVANTKKLGESLGKQCIVSKDSPAFIVNRLLVPMMNEAIGLLETGVGSVEDIDAGARLGLNHPMGPLEVADMAGVEVALAAQETIFRETGDPRYRPAKLWRNMVRMGWHGQKTKKGFYLYHEDGTKEPNPDLF